MSISEKIDCMSITHAPIQVASFFSPWIVTPQFWYMTLLSGQYFALFLFFLFCYFCVIYWFVFGNWVKLFCYIGWFSEGSSWSPLHLIYTGNSKLDLHISIISLPTAAAVVCWKSASFVKLRAAMPIWRTRLFIISTSSTWPVAYIWLWIRGFKTKEN